MEPELKTTVTVYSKDGRAIQADIDQLECALKDGYTKTPPKLEPEVVPTPAPAKSTRRTRATS